MTTIAWVKEDPFGTELVEASRADRTLSVIGVAIGSEPVPYRLDYVLETDTDLVTTRIVVTTRGNGWRRALTLRRAQDGSWSSRTADTNPLAGALDVDLGLSPLTNTMPVVREGLLDGRGSVEFLMAWISVPGLEVTPAPQRYTALEPDPDGARRVRFESLDSDFTAELTYDDEGFVVDYPGLARRITA